MNLEHHVPSLTHLRAFARARAAGRPTHVATDRRQVAAAGEARIQAFVYEKFITAVIEYVRNGSRGAAMDRAAAAAPDRMRPSYSAAAVGMTRVIAIISPTDAARRQHNVVVTVDEEDLVSLRIHLVFDLPSEEQVCAFMYFSEDRLTDTEIAVMETAITLASMQVNPSARPAIISVRSGDVAFVDRSAATTAARVEFLRQVSAEYRAEWAAAA